jgi:methionyl-tRNA synthetase
VPLPEGKGKVIYVWFDAPIGYISSTKEWAEKTGRKDKWKDYWQDPSCRLVHFIGKDNIVFHSIMWPAVLMGNGGFILPWQVPANEFLNLEGSKVSTSRGYAIWVHEFLRDFPADSLRYYIASIAPETKDSDFLLQEFRAAHNNELADILGNFVNRVVTFVTRYFDGRIPHARTGDPESAAMTAAIRKAAQEMEKACESFQLRRSVSVFMNLCRDGNKYFNDRAPWKSRKEDPAGCADTLNTCLLVIRALSILASPLIPFAAEKMRGLFPASCRAGWDGMDKPLPEGGALSPAGILFAKIEDAAIDVWAEKLKRLKS